MTSFYGAQATLASLSAYGRVVGLGAVAGGAHANPRPSFFVGGPTAVAEREQNFYVYGGENAVGIVSVAAGPRTLLMVGQWAPGRPPGERRPVDLARRRALRPARRDPRPRATAPAVSARPARRPPPPSATGSSSSAR